MSNQEPHHWPTAIQLHQKSRILSITFEDGKQFALPCEYLRIFSPAAEVKAGTWVSGKENINILRIEPQGQYAARLVFDDGHDTGIYSWDTLYALGEQQANRWAEYLQWLEAAGIERQTTSGQKRVKLLYFAYLADKLRASEETLELPAQVIDVTSLLAWLRKRRPKTAPLFADDRVRVTVNRQFAEGLTRLDEGDEIALVPTSPNPPPTPDLH